MDVQFEKLNFWRIKNLNLRENSFYEKQRIFTKFNHIKLDAVVYYAVINTGLVISQELLETVE